MVLCHGSDDYLGACVGGLEPYVDGRGLDGDYTETIYT